MPDLWGRRQTTGLRALHEFVNYVRILGDCNDQMLVDAASSLRANIFYQEDLRDLCVQVCFFAAAGLTMSS